MKLITKCEKQFVSNCVIKRQKRLDGRELLQGRALEIIFGKERGCCLVMQGNTRVLVQVTCEISEPKASTPTEGIIHVNFELSAMAAPEAKSLSRTSEEAVEAQRAIERCVRDSKCIDLESLCIVTASKVWTIRVDVHTLNDDGNLIECASVAAISALAHFRRPEVTVVGTDVTVHSTVEREPVALNLHHMPISINLALFHDGKYILVDPSEIEERVCDGCYVIGLNAHQEICFVHRRGVLLLKEEAIQKCESIAVKRAQEITQVIRSALDDDAYKRSTNATIGFTNLIQSGTILGAKRQMAEISLESMQNLQASEEPEIQEVGDTAVNGLDSKEEMIADISQLISDARQATHISQDDEQAVFEGGLSKWGDELDEDSSEEEEEEEVGMKETEVKEEISIDSEEETVYVNKEQLDVKNPSARGWYSKDPFN